MYYYVVLLFSVLILSFSGLKSSKLIIFAGVTHNVLSIFNSLTLESEVLLILYILSFDVQTFV